MDSVLNKNEMLKLLLLVLFLLSGISTQVESQLPENRILESNYIARTVSKRFKPPHGYERISSKSSSFQAYLQHLPLKPEGSLVHYYNGSTKPNYGEYVAVVDLDIGDKDLHQCADAIMRLKADYLYQQRRFDEIHFNFTNGHRVNYSKWKQGYRMEVKGNKTKWVKTANPEEHYESFWEYLELIFMYAGTKSLSQELKSISIEEMEIGDIFIQGGFPGHAMIVIDMAINQQTGEKVYMLAQSYMPAQEIHIVSNPYDEGLSPWYKLSGSKDIITPEWSFSTNDLMRFE